MNSSNSRGVSHIAVTAALSLAILVSAGGIQLGKTFAKPLPVDPASLEPISAREYLAIDDANENGIPDWQDELAQFGVAIATSSEASSSVAVASSTDPISGIGAALAQTLIGGYLSLSQYDAYTPERGEQLANTIADNFRAPQTFQPHTVDELTLVPDTSVTRARTYRTDMQIALTPLITDEEYELTLFAAYIETEDSRWLERLAAQATVYRTAEENLLALAAPQDAAPEHLRLVNAIGAFADTLDRMARFAHDPLAAMALLRTYNEAERDVDLAFDALVKYYARTIGDN